MQPDANPWSRIMSQLFLHCAATFFAFFSVSVVPGFKASNLGVWFNYYSTELPLVADSVLIISCFLILSLDAARCKPLKLGSWVNYSSTVLLLFLLFSPCYSGAWIQSLELRSMIQLFFDCVAVGGWFRINYKLFFDFFSWCSQMQTLEVRIVSQLFFHCAATFLLFSLLQWCLDSNSLT